MNNKALFLNACVLSLFCFSAPGPASRKTTPEVLPPQVSDLSIRFAHVEPVYNDPAILAHWSMDEGSGYEFADQSGKGHTAYITGSNWNTTSSGLTASFRRKGKRAGCVFLDGTQWLQVQAAGDLNPPAQLTVAAWIKPADHPGKAAGQALISGRAGKGGYALTVGKQNNLTFTIADAALNEHTLHSPANSLPGNRWTHVLATADAVRGELCIYVDGKPAGSIRVKPFSPAAATAGLTIGHASGAPGAFSGWVDEVTIWQKALTEGEVRQRYAVGLPKLYAQTRETIDASRATWTAYKGNQPVPHPIEDDTRLLLDFDGRVTTHQGRAPAENPGDAIFVPGAFGGALDATRYTRGLTYPSPVAGEEGAFEAWFIPVPDPKDPHRERKRVILSMAGKNADLTLFSRNRKWVTALNAAGKPAVTLESAPQTFAYGSLLHLGLTWGNGEMTLYLNGVAAGRKPLPAAPVLDGNLTLGGKGAEAAHGYLDDVRISGRVRDWRMVCPRGHVDTESPALDLMQGFDHDPGEPLMHWTPGSPDARWAYAAKSAEDDGTQRGDPGESGRSLAQRSDKGLHPVFHPDAHGNGSSAEAGVSFETVKNGWAGVFVQSPEGPAGKAFTGYTFTLNPAAGQLRLAMLKDGAITASKVLPYDFRMAAHRTYTLTLSSTGGILRGYVDGHNLISLAGAAPDAAGFAGLLTEDIPAHFDNFHFTALTLPVAQSRQIQLRLFSDGSRAGISPVAQAVTLNAFRWKKRPGLLPWQRNYKSPEPPGNLFGPTDSVPRPNSSQFWRSEDAANSDVLTVDGTVYYVMRGNPDFGGPHGPAALGMLFTPADRYDGIHFTDQNAGTRDLARTRLLRGHVDTGKECSDQPPRSDRFQINDQGAVYQDGKLLVFAREFRNHIEGFPWFRRLVFGIFDPKTQRWEEGVPRLVDWSSMNPDSCHARFHGLNATPEVTSLRDPVTDEYIIFLYHHGRKTAAGLPTTGIVGLRFDGKNVHLHPDYPPRDSYTKHNGDNIYGDRIMFDNGIYYMHVNAGSDESKLKGDWPDRFGLFTALHPYEGPWAGSAENTNTARVYFSRGSEFDPDNGAIWQGTMFKHRGKYYLYYENFHVIENIDRPYDHYDHKHSGSRVGFATAN